MPPRYAPHSTVSGHFIYYYVRSMWKQSYRSELFWARRETFVDHDVGCVHTRLRMLHLLLILFNLLPRARQRGRHDDEMCDPRHLMEHKIPSKFQPSSVLTAFSIVFFLFRGRVPKTKSSERRVNCLNYNSTYFSSFVVFFFSLLFSINRFMNNFTGIYFITTFTKWSAFTFVRIG